jgi:oligoendopeptidase F
MVKKVPTKLYSSNMKKKLDIKLKWDLTQLFTDSEDYIKEYEENVVKALEAFINKWKDRNDYLSDPKVLFEALSEHSSLMEKYGFFTSESFYLGLSESLDQENTDLKARANLLHAKTMELYNKMQFFSLNIAKIPEEKQSMFLESDLLKEYRHSLETDFRLAKYLLSEPEEKILNIADKTSSWNWQQMVSDLLAKETGSVVDSKGKKSKLTFSEIMSKIDSTDKVQRDSAAKQIHKINKKHSEVATYELNSILEDKYNSDKLRGYDRPDKARHISDSIETEVVDALIKAVTDRFDLSQEYYRIKAKHLGLKKLEYHERNVPVGKIDVKYTLDQGISLVNRSLNTLDPEFSDIFEGFVEEGRVDFLPKKSKSDGAYCASVNNVTPIYILMNYTEKLNDVLTLAHEVGHGIHYTLARAQKIQNYGASLATAEVASTFMEDFVISEIENGMSDKEKELLTMTRLNDDVSTIFRQVACYNFEKDLHLSFREKGFLSTKEIGEIFMKHMKSYMGDAVNYNKGSENWWVYWSHIRRFFYVYSYASGLLISKSLQSLVRSNPKNISKVKDFMKAGESDSPLNIFKKAGLDISQGSFWNEGLGEVESALKRVY